MKSSVIFSVIFLAYAILLSVLEGFAYTQGGVWSVIASKTWMLGGLIVLLCSLHAVFSTLISDFREKTFLGPLALVSIAVITFIHIDSFSYYINGEAAHQVSNALEHIVDPDMGYTRCGFFCYPNRQYIIAAAPTIFLGRTLIALRLSYLIPFFIGTCVFYSGLRMYIRKWRSFRQVPGVCISSILTYPFIVLFLRGPEQSIMPLCLVLLTLGWLMLTFCKRRMIDFHCLGWCTCMLATSYSPGLSAWAYLILLLFAWGVYLLRERANKIQALFPLACILMAITFGLCSFFMRTDFHFELIQRERGSLKDILHELFTAYSMFFLRTGSFEDQTFSSVTLMVPTFLYFLLALFVKRWRLFHCVNCVWIVGTIAAAVHLSGYAPTEAAHDIHRAMIIVPFLLIGQIAMLTTLFTDTVYLRICLYILFICNIAVSGWNLFHVHRSYYDRTNRPIFELLEDAVATTRSEHLIGLSNRFVVISDQYDFNLWDYLRYFLPNIQAFVREGCHEITDSPTQEVVIAYYDPNQCTIPSTLSPGYLRLSESMNGNHLMGRIIRYPFTGPKEGG